MTAIVNQKNASGLRRYFIEYTVLFLTAAVVVLFYMYVGLSNKVVELQTTVIQKNTEANIELKAELVNIKNSIK
jgi:hypothetical protein